MKQPKYKVGQVIRYNINPSGAGGWDKSIIREVRVRRWGIKYAISDSYLPWIWKIVEERYIRSDDLPGESILDSENKNKPTETIATGVENCITGEKSIAVGIPEKPVQLVHYLQVLVDNPNSTTLYKDEIVRIVNIEGEDIQVVNASKYETFTQTLKMDGVGVEWQTTFRQMCDIQETVE